VAVTKKRLDRIEAKLKSKKGAVPEELQKQWARIRANELSPFEKAFLECFESDQQKCIALAFAEGLPAFAEKWGISLPTVDEMRGRRVAERLERRRQCLRRPPPREDLEAAEAAVRKEEAEAEQAKRKRKPASS